MVGIGLIVVVVGAVVVVVGAVVGVGSGWDVEPRTAVVVVLAPSVVVVDGGCTVEELTVVEGDVVTWVVVVVLWIGAARGKLWRDPLGDPDPQAEMTETRDTSPRIRAVRLTMEESLFVAGFVYWLVTQG